MFKFRGDLMITSMNESINLNEDSLLEERIAQETEERCELACWLHFFCPSQYCIEVFFE